MTNEKKPATMVVVAGVFERPNPRGAGYQVLLAKRGSTELGAGLWHFPGGKVRFCEPIAEALPREISEEIGVRSSLGRSWPITICEMVFPGPGHPITHVLSMHYHVALLSGTPQPLDGTDEVGWFDQGECFEMSAQDLLLRSACITLWCAMGWETHNRIRPGLHNPALGLTAEEWLRRLRLEQTSR